MRAVDYVRVAGRDISDQPMRSVLTMVSIAISSALFVALVSLGLQGRDALIGQLSQGDALQTLIVSNSAGVGGGFFSTSVQVSNADGNPIDDSVVKNISVLPSVNFASPQVNIWEFKAIKVEGSGNSFLARAVGTSSSDARKNGLAAGNWFSDDAEHVIVLGNGYARALGYNEDPEELVGKTVTITTIKGYRGADAIIPAWNANKDAQQTFASSDTTITANIIGVTAKSSSDNAFYLPLNWAHQIKTARTSSVKGEVLAADPISSDGYDNIYVMANSEADVQGLTNKIEALGYGVSNSQKQIEQINQLSVSLWVILGSVALISLASSSLGIVNTLLISINEQSKAISIWRACGATKGMIVRVYVLQAGIVAIIGSFLGSLTGWAISGVVNTYLNTELAAQGLQRLVIPAASLNIILLSIIITTLLAVLASLYPARKAARLVA